MISENPTTEELQRRIRALEREVADYKARLADQRTSEMKQRRYGLVWEDVPEAFDAEAENSIPILEEDTSLSVLQDDGQPTHLLIEGDNYHALTCLNYTHRGRIDVIYIDPPYNTGSDGFTYRDRRFLTEFPNGQKIDTTHPLRHSAWLSFMEKRLRLAKELLSQRGVIFISIDDNEQATLKLLCDIIFGKKCFLQNLIIESNPRGSQSSKYFATTHEYVLCYSRTPNPDISFGVSKGEEEMSEYSQEDSKGKFRVLGLRQRGGAWRRSDRPKLYFPIYVNTENGEVSLERDLLHTVEVLPKRPTGEESRWTWSKEKIKKQINEIIGIKVNEGTDKEKWDIGRKNYLSNEDGRVKATKVKSIWAEKEINYQNGGTEIKDMLGDRAFAYPKPLFFIKKIFSIATQGKNSLILDFFAGSGTTLHAVAQLNADDGGHRQCILVQQQEDTKICEKVTRERCRKVLTGYRSSKGEDVKGLGGSLRYYRTAFVGKHRAAQAGDEDAVALSLKAGCLLAIAENTLCETKHTDAYQLYTDHAGRTTAIYFRESVEEFDDFLADIRKTEGHVVAYVFSWGDASEFEDDFLDFDGRVELKAIPKPILDIYKALA